MRNMTRRKLLQLALLAGATVPVVGASACSPSPSAAPGSLTIGYVPIACAAPVALADADDLFSRHGVDVTLRKYAGWADLWSAYSTGELDVAHMLSPMPLAINAGATSGMRPTELSYTQNTNGQAITLAATHRGQVHSAEDFRGMVLGIPFEYSVHALLLRDFLSAGGVDPVADVELRLLRPADMVAQLEVGGIDGFIGPEPFNQRALETGSGAVFTMTKELWDRHPCCSVSMAKDWRAAHPEQAAGVIAALNEASRLLGTATEHERIAVSLSREEYLNQPAQLLTAPLAGTYENWHGQQVHDPERMSFGDPTDPTAITWMATQIARWGLGGQALVMDDATLIREARDILPPDVHRAAEPVRINGQLFDPAHPTAGYEGDFR